MIELVAAANEIQQYLNQRGWQFCVIGGLAVQRWGSPRATQDVDLTLLTGIGEEFRFIDALLTSFSARRPDSRQVAEQARVLLIAASNGTPLDVSLGWLPYEERLIERASPFDFAPGSPVFTCSAEDLIVTKAFANRPRDWVDVDDVISVQRGNLDWECIERELTELCTLREDNEPLLRLLQSKQRLV